MKISLAEARFYAGQDLPGSSTEELVQKIGAQLGAVEEVIDYGKRYDKIVLSRVITCQKHPNADKLSLCTIDDGGITPDVNREENGYIQVVCGAPNVREGLYVAWIPPGAVVPATFDKDQFVIEAREIRGVMSNGMLASASELAINDDHSGLLEVDIDNVNETLAKTGTPFKNLFGLDDIIIDIENKMFTHRPDCFGVLGVTREIFGIYGEQFKSPEWYLQRPVFEEVQALPLAIKNEIPELVPRFMAVAIDNIQIGPSPIWMQAVLTRIGVKPINNVVDITNFNSYITGQPTHAYDYDKVAALSSGDDAVLLARLPRDGESVALLNGKTITPREDAIMIATDKELVGIGGVMGGITTEVDDNTKRIIIECANFDMYSIRKTSMYHGLFTDAVTRFNKGQSPLQNDRVLRKIMNDIGTYASGKQASSVIDLMQFDAKDVETESFEAKYINERLGTNLNLEEIEKLLKNVEFETPKIEGRGMLVKAPFWRTDIQIIEDVVEEVGRLNGYDKLPVVLPSKGIAPSMIDPMLKLKYSLRNKLAAYGANEILTYSFVNEKLIKNTGQNPELAFKIVNAISPELEYYRLSLTPSILAHVHQNIKAGQDKFALFEIGKVHGKSEIDDHNLPQEFGRVSLVVGAKQGKNGAYFTARRYLEALGNFRLVPYNEELSGNHQLIQAMMVPYEPSRSAMVLSESGMPVGIVGEFKLSVIRSFKLPDYCAGFEMFLSSFKGLNGRDYMPLSAFPSITQDLCLEVSADLPYVVVYEDLTNAMQGANTDAFNIELSLIDIFAGQEIEGRKRITFRIKVNSYERTLTDSVVSSLLDQTIAALDSSKFSRI